MKLVKISLNLMLWILRDEENRAVSLNFREMGKMTSYKKTDIIQNQRMFLSLSYDFLTFIIFLYCYVCLKE